MDTLSLLAQIEQLTAENEKLVSDFELAKSALAYMTACHKDWSERAIMYKATIERTNEIALQQAQYHREFAYKYTGIDGNREKRHLERVSAWLSIMRFSHEKT